MIFGQPLDSLFGAVGLILLVAGLGYAGWGAFQFMTAKGKKRIVGGLVALIIGASVFFVFGMPVIPGGIAPSNPQQPTGAAWSIYYTSANPGTLGSGAYPTTAAGLLLADPGDTSIMVHAAPYNYFFFNVTLVPPAGANTFSGNVIFQLVTPVPTLTNTSNQQTFGPVLATRTNGVYDCSLTPNSGSASYQSSTFAYTSGTARTLAAQCKLGSIISQLALAQYPVSFTLSFTVTDAASGALYGTLTQTFTLSYTEVSS